MPDVLVIGAGVTGLTTAVCLAEADLRVRVWAERTMLDTTSCAAGAIWGAYLTAHHRAGAWGQDGLDTFAKLAESEPHSGVRMVTGIEASRLPGEPPAWATEIPDFHRCTADDLPAGFVSGWRSTVPIIEMPTYLRYLTNRLAATGTEVETRSVSSLAAAATAATHVINCTGVGARHLVADLELAPVRGELVVVENPGVDEFFAEHTEGVKDLTYLLPQGDRLVLGGSADEGRFDTVPDPAIGDGILARCVAVEPRLRGARVLDRRVGLRPGRRHIRVERDAVLANVFHNYGHGGAGVTLSWGCAREILAMWRAS